MTGPCMVMCNSQILNNWLNPFHALHTLQLKQHITFTVCETNTLWSCWNGRRGSSMDSSLRWLLVVCSLSSIRHRLARRLHRHVKDIFQWRKWYGAQLIKERHPYWFLVLAFSTRKKACAFVASTSPKGWSWSCLAELDYLKR